MQEFFLWVNYCSKSQHMHILFTSAVTTYLSKLLSKNFYFLRAAPSVMQFFYAEVYFFSRHYFKIAPFSRLTMEEVKRRRNNCQKQS